MSLEVWPAAVLLKRVVEPILAVHWTYSIVFSLGGIAFGITKFMTSLTKAFNDVGGLLDNVKNILDGVRGCFEAYRKPVESRCILKNCKRHCYFGKNLS